MREMLCVAQAIGSVAVQGNALFLEMMISLSHTSEWNSRIVAGAGRAANDSGRLRAASSYTIPARITHAGMRQVLSATANAKAVLCVCVFV